MVYGGEEGALAWPCMVRQVCDGRHTAQLRDKSCHEGNRAYEKREYDDDELSTPHNNYVAACLL